MRRFKSGGAVRSAVRACSMLLMTCALLADSASARQQFRIGRLVHGSVKTVVGQNSRPVSIAVRSRRQNCSSCFCKRASASTLPSSTTWFRLCMMPPPSICVSEAV